MKLRKIITGILLAFACLVKAELSQAQGCKDSALREKVTQVAQQAGVDEKELLSVIAHESSCHYYVIAWNFPKKPQSAQSKFFNSLDETKRFAQELIATGQYRVDVGIGQINNEAHIQPRKWTLEEVLTPETALNRVATVLKERGWANYHSSDPERAKKWQGLALAALDRALSNTDSRFKTANLRPVKSVVEKNRGPLVIFNSSMESSLQKEPFQVKIVSPQTFPLMVFNSPASPNEPKKETTWVVYGRL